MHYEIKKASHKDWLYMVTDYYKENYLVLLLIVFH